MKLCVRCNTKKSTHDLYQCAYCRLLICNFCLEPAKHVGSPNLCRQSCGYYYRQKERNMLRMSRNPPRRTPPAYKVGQLVFLPQSSVSYSAFYVIARSYSVRETGKVRYVCHKMDAETGLPMACPDSRCEGKGWACCTITINGGWHEEVEPLTRGVIDIFSNDAPTILDREFALNAIKLLEGK